MIILEILGRIFIEILWEGIIYGFFNLIGKGFSKLKELITGVKKPDNPIEVLEKKYLYKIIELTDNVNSKLKVGQRGAVMEIIDESKVFAEFYDQKGNLIEWDDELAFEIGMEQFRLKK
ncbi:hypothetical protein [Flagellimonas onchidii]|uniref:hypothetical protein n=1 Tax=Flagellimonas onchidii TaxID=2562684 RepID=UPI0010A5C918|nr:hypothetical protein [Allomuricauda onchidii]